MWKTALPLLAATAVCLAPPSVRADPAPTCVTVQRGSFGTVADTLLSVDAPSSPFATSPSMNTGRSGGGNCCNQSLVRFDLSFIPVGSTVTSATFGVRLSYTEQVGTVRLHNVLWPWAEATATAQSFLGAGAFNPATLASFGIGMYEVGQKTADVTAQAASWVSAPEANFGLLLEEDGTAGHLFWTGEASTVSWRPRLDICYVTPPPCPSGFADCDGDSANGCETDMNDMCIANLCTGQQAVTCAASDQCHAAGTCDPASGACSDPAVADGAACNDGDACTEGDACVAGACAGAISCNLDDLFVYRPGRGAAYALQSNPGGTFETVYAVGDNGSAAPNGVAGYNLLSNSDRVLAFDHDGDGLGDLLLYRPGTGAVTVARSNGDGSFTSVYAVADAGLLGIFAPHGIGGYDLLSSADQVFAFDYNADGVGDLFLYRPGTGAVSVVRSNGDGTFTAVYAVADAGLLNLLAPHGIAGHNLLSSADRVLPFDYNGDGLDDLVLYRPGKGAVTVARSNGDGSFTAVYSVADNGSALPNGIAGYDLLSNADEILPFDHDGDGLGDLFLYRPGSGAAHVACSNGDGSFTAVYAVGDNGAALPNGIGGFDLLSSADRVLRYDVNGDGLHDLLLYRPGSGAISIASSNGDGTFTAVHTVSDDGVAAPNGIGSADLLSPADRIVVLDLGD